MLSAAPPAIGNSHPDLAVEIFDLICEPEEADHVMACHPRGFLLTDLWCSELAGIFSSLVPKVVDVAATQPSVG
jgi:hypothetical protein